MANNYQNRNQGQGGQGSRPNNSKPAQPKTEIRVRHEYKQATADTYDLLLKVRCLTSGQPMAGEEIMLEKGLTYVGSVTLDTDGNGQFDLTGRLTDREQKIDFTISLSGTSFEKTLTVVIPSKAAPTKKDLQIRIISQGVNSGRNVYQAVFEVTALDENNYFVGQDVSAIVSHLPKIIERTDNRGVAIFKFAIPQEKMESTCEISFRLEQWNYEEKISVVVPALDKKKEPDAEHLILMSQTDGQGNFRVKIRILEEKGKGMANKAFSVFYRGLNFDLVTNCEGEHIFDVPGILGYDEKEFLTVSVSGIKESARIRLRRGRDKSNDPESFTSEWLWEVNNGRAFVLLCLTAFFWLLAILIGPGKPIINSSMFREKVTIESAYTNQAGSKHKTEKSRLSESEIFYNEAAAYVGQDAKIPSGERPYSWFSIKLWILCVVLTFIALIYAVLSAREEIAEAFEELAEKLFDKSSDEVGDPALERLARLAGLYSEVRRKPEAVTVAGQTDITAPPAASVGGSNTVDVQGHPSLGTLFRLDLLSDTLVQVIPAILKKIWGRG